MTLRFLFVKFAFACHNYDKKNVHIPKFLICDKITIVFQFHSNKLCIVHNINMEGTVSQNFDIRIRFKDIKITFCFAIFITLYYFK